VRGHRHRLLTLGVLAGAAALTGAGFPAKDVPGKEVSAEKWVKSVCTSLGDWADDLTAAQEDVDQSETDLDRKQDDLVAYLEEVTDATNALVKRLKKAGTPDVEDGKGVAKAFRRGFTQARDTFADAAEDAADLETGDRAQFEDDVLEIQDAIRAGADDIAATFDEADEKYDVPELDEAFDDEPSCSGVT
jgi:hypothetical protein